MDIRKSEFYEQTGVAMTCRSFEEYMRMFSLEEIDLAAGPILDAAAGASSFTAGCKQRGLLSIAADPLYRMDAAAMSRHGQKEIEESTQKLAGLAYKYNWDYYGNLERHLAAREQSLELFLADYSAPGAAQRYVNASFPALPFADGSFSLALCSHFLFLYQEQFDYDFHLGALRELLRVVKLGGQIRVYPILGLKYNPYPRFDDLVEALKSEGTTVESLPSGLPFLPGSTHFLRLVKSH